MDFFFSPFFYHEGMMSVVVQPYAIHNSTAVVRTCHLLFISCFLSLYKMTSAPFEIIVFGGFMIVFVEAKVPTVVGRNALPWKPSGLPFTDTKPDWHLVKVNIGRYRVPLHYACDTYPASYETPIISNWFIEMIDLLTYCLNIPDSFVVEVMTFEYHTV